MTQKDKELLLKDLCARLPYDIIVQDDYGDYIEVNIHTANLEHLIDRVSVGIVKMVLHPMSSMTKEEKEQMRDLWIDADTNSHAIRLIDFYNKNHFDYRGWIDKCLALSTEEFNPYKD